MNHLKEITHQYNNIFCAAYDYAEKADLSKGFQNPKRKLGVAAHFSEIIGKKLSYILRFLTLF